MKTFIIYHKADLDGLFGARACYRDIPVEDGDNSVEMVPMQYGDEIDIERMKGGVVRMVDFSLPREKMQWLNENTDFTWIDHHKSAIQEMEGLEIKGRQEIGKGACLLAYEYFERPFFYSEEEVVTLLSKYDVRDQSNMIDWNEMILPFQYGMRLEVGLDMEKVGNFMKNIVGEETQNIIEKGKTILAYNKQNREGWMKKSGEISIEYFITDCDSQFPLRNYKGLAVFGPAGGSSQVFESKRDNTKYDVMVYITYNITKKEYAISLYSDKDTIDCSIIAKHFGGGGHKGASGFVCNVLPFSL